MFRRDGGFGATGERLHLKIVAVDYGALALYPRQCRRRAYKSWHGAPLRSVSATDDGPVVLVGLTHLRVLRGQQRLELLPLFHTSSVTFLCSSSR